MPNLFVVTDQPNLSALATAVLRGRTSMATRTAALDAIRLANPTLDLDRLRPGAVVVIPAVPGVRPAATDDPVAEVADDLIGRVRDGLAALTEADGRGEESRRLDQKDAFELFDSGLVQRLARSEPQVGENIASVRAAFEQENVEAKRHGSDLRKAVDGWGADLDVLRGLL